MAQLLSLIRRPDMLAMAVIIGLALAYPLWASYYGLTVARDTLILGIFALSLDLLWGRAGLPSFGHAAFFGLGGYAYALIAGALDPSYGTLVALAGAILLGAAAGFLLGTFLLPAGVRGALFLIVTIAVTQILHQVSISWSSVTGGDNGLVGVPELGLTLFSVEVGLRDPVIQFYFALALCAGLLMLLWLTLRGRYGRILAAVVNNEVRAQTLGVNTPWALILALTASTTIAALAGAIYVSMVSIMVPDLIGPAFSVEVAVWVLIGGRGTLIGPVVATSLVWRLSQELSSVNPTLWPLAIGVIFIAMVFLLPSGIGGLLARVARNLRRSAGAAYGRT